MRVWFWGTIGLLGLLLSEQALAEPTVIQLTQTACQFVEAEAQDYAFQSNNFSNCNAINQQTEDKRLALSQTLHLKPGTYVFHVQNRDVPYKLGFWLRGEGLGRLTLPSISGGNIEMGMFKDYTVTLKKGDYLYSCPLNPTPNYRLQVN